MDLTIDFKKKVIDALSIVRENFEGSDGQFAKRWGMSAAVYSRLKNGETDRILKDAQWLNIGRELNVTLNERKWNIARTDVFSQIEDEVNFCKKYSKSMIFVDKNEIGKTVAAKYLARTLKNCFYVDASQCETKTVFIRQLAKVLGVEESGTINSIKENIKYYLRMIVEPVVIIDDPGDMDFRAFFTIKEFQNATESVCGWYLVGDEGMREKWDRSIRNNKIGFKAIYSRCSSKFRCIVPAGKEDKQDFYKKLVGDVLSANMKDKSKLNTIVRKCIVEDEYGNFGGLRRAESLLILNGEI